MKRAVFTLFKHELASLSTEESIFIIQICGHKMVFIDSVERTGFNGYK